MENSIEHEICNNCKKEIPQPNYVMHTMHCARNITLCKICKEPVPKAQFSDHEKTCKKPVEPKPLPPITNIEKSSYFQTRKAIEDKKAENRKERYLQKMDRLVDTGYSLKDSNGFNSSQNSIRSNREVSSYERESTMNDYRSRDFSNNYGRDSTSNFSRQYGRENSVDSPSRFSNARENGYSSQKKPEVPQVEKQEASAVPPLIKRSEPVKSSGMLACKFCDLELPKLDLEEHENYCGTRTDKCLECGELVMYKDKQAHMDSTHIGVKRRGGQRTAGWDSSTERNESSNGARERPNRAIRPMGEFDYDPMPYLPSAYQSPRGGARKKEGESYKEISRRLDCKTEYIRNILHDSAAITVPLRRTGTAPRNYFYHQEKANFGSPAPPAYRRRNPPTELVIPCEFCNVPIPHEELIQHETGCRPDLAKYNPRRRNSPEDDYYVEPRQASVDEEDLPCEFCGDMIPASQLYSHQIRCT